MQIAADLIQRYSMLLNYATTHWNFSELIDRFVSNL